MKMEETRFSETAVITKPTRRHIPGDSILYNQFMYEACGQDIIQVLFKVTFFVLANFCFSFSY
jgi:hypothetical protein